ncbi:MAG: FecR domain-containing protein [Planctomycetota bacterium]|nr:FecR domain-containing protein [Planctomycetota bacterium]
MSQDPGQHSNGKNQDVKQLASPESPVTEEDRELVDRYFSEEADAEETALLEARLIASRELRDHFAKHSRLVVDLTLSARSSRASQQVLHSIRESVHERESQRTGPRQPAILIAMSLCLLFGLWLGSILSSRPKTPSGPIAWLVNAHDCQWGTDSQPGSGMGPDERLQLESGVAHLRFACGADMTLEGPATLQFLSGTSAQLERGKVAVKVPDGMSGFEIFSPQGRVLDLGTEFGVEVTPGGDTRVVVFDGEVQTFLNDESNGSVKLLENQSAFILENEIKSVEQVEGTFVRNVEEVWSYRGNKKVQSPQTTELVFDGSASLGLRDAEGQHLGLNRRLTGTGEKLSAQDGNLVIDKEQQLLKLTTTRSDINHQVNLETGEYLGFRLSDFGFSGEEDFAVTVLVPNIPDLEDFGQFGLYAGRASDEVIRGGIIKWGMRNTGANTIFMVNNHGGEDSDSNKVGLLNEGTDLRLVLSRRKGKYALSVENLSDGGTTSLTIKHPSYLDDATDLEVGIFGANPYSGIRKTVYITSFSVTLWK